VTPEEYFATSPLGLAAYAWVRARVDDDCEVRASSSQVAFRKVRGFAYLWLPGRYLTHPRAEVVLSVARGRADTSPRWKEVAHPAPNHWMHHLELCSVADLDGEVATWLAEAERRAASPVHRGSR
jgi:hypothetical protein